MTIISRKIAITGADTLITGAKMVITSANKVIPKFDPVILDEEDVRCFFRRGMLTWRKGRWPSAT